MTSLELVSRTALALFLCTAHLYVSLRVTLALRVGRSIFATGATFLTVGLCGAALSFHLLLALHLYTLPYASLLAVLACGAAAWGTRAAGTTDLALRRFTRTMIRLRRLLARSPHRGRVYFFAVTASLLGIRALLFYPNSHDTVVYHATKAALWVQQNDLGAMWGPGQWELYGLFPGGAELFTSLAMLPLRSDLYACSVDLLMWLGLGFASLAFHRELGMREPYGSIAAGFLLGIPTFRLLVGSGYIEPTLCFTFVLGSYFTLRSCQRDRGGPSALLALAAMGLSASTKFSIMAPALVAGGIVAAAALFARGKRLRALAWTLAGSAVALALIAPWLLNSLRFTGYPLSPIPLKVAGVTLGASRMFELFTTTTPYPTPYVWQNEWPLLKTTFAFPVGPLQETVGFFSALALVLAPLGWVRLARRRPLRALVLVLLTAACAWTYLEPHMAQVRFLWVASSSRFLLPALCMSVPAALLAAGRGGEAITWIARLFWAGFIVNALCFGLPWLTHYDVFGALWVFAMLGAGAVLTRRARAKWPERTAGLVALHLGVAVAFGAGLYAYKDPRRYEFVRDNTVLHPYDRRWWAAAERLDREPGKQIKVALTSGSALPCIWYAYYFMGRHFQNHLTYVSPLPDGRRPGFCPSDGWEPEARFDVWLRRLREQGIHDIVSFSLPSVELSWMLAHPELFEPVEVNPAEGGYFRLK